MVTLLSSTALAPPVIELIELGIHHEQQHQELIVTDLKHLLSRNPLRPVYVEPGASPESRLVALTWLGLPDGIRQIGHAQDGFGFDNEQPRHRVFIDAYEIASRPVTNAEYLEFMADGGYQRPEFWLSEGMSGMRSPGTRRFTGRPSAPAGRPIPSMACSPSIAPSR